MSTLLEKGRAGAPPDIDPFIDVHGHLGRFGFAIPDLSVEGVLRVMDRLGVQKILVSHMTCMSYEVAWGNDQIAQAIRRYPGRLEGYVGL